MFSPTYTLREKQTNKIQDTRRAARFTIWTPPGYKSKTFRNELPRKQVQVEGLLNTHYIFLCLCDCASLIQ